VTSLCHCDITIHIHLAMGGTNNKNPIIISQDYSRLSTTILH
jgi:hypothetical protein